MLSGTAFAQTPKKTENVPMVNVPTFCAPAAMLLNKILQDGFKEWAKTKNDKGTVMVIWKAPDGSILVSTTIKDSVACLIYGSEHPLVLTGEGV